jgi:hypothetical protein
MHKILLPILLTSSIIACSNNENKSSLKLVDSHSQVLELEKGFYSRVLNVDAGRINMVVNKIGQLEYSLLVDLSMVGIPFQTLRFDRRYQLNSEFVQYETFKRLGAGDTLEYIEDGLELAYVEKIQEANGIISLRVQHLPTGMNLDVDISETKDGLVDIQRVGISGATMVNIPDPDGGRTWIYDEQLGYSRIVSKMFSALFKGKVVVSKQ